MEEQVTWNDMMQYTKLPFDESVGKYWVRDPMDGVRSLTVYLDPLWVKDVIAFSYAWTHLEVRMMYPSLIQDLGFDRLLQLEVTEKPQILKTEGLLDILYAIWHLKPHMFAGKRPREFDSVPLASWGE